MKTVYKDAQGRLYVSPRCAGSNAEVIEIYDVGEFPDSDVAARAFGASEVHIQDKTVVFVAEVGDFTASTTATIESDSLIIARGDMAFGGNNRV